MLLSIFEDEKLEFWELKNISKVTELVSNIDRILIYPNLSIYLLHLCFISFDKNISRRSIKGKDGAASVGLVRNSSTQAHIHLKYFLSY